MMKNIHRPLMLFSVVAAFILALSCSRKQAHYDEMASISEEAMPVSAARQEIEAEEVKTYSATDYVSSSAARVGKADSARKFIRTAALRFEVKDAIRATYAIEDIIVRNGGFVASTELATSVSNYESVKISRDSTLVSTYYTINNNMVLRVPFRKLDATLKEIAGWADFMEYRKVTATDAQLDLLRNNLTRRRAERQEKRLARAIDEKGQKLNQIADAEDRLADQQERADDALISNMELQDRIEYSIISIHLFQTGSCRREVLADSKNIDEYRPGFGVRCGEALQAGWRAFVAVVIFLTNFWMLYVLIAALIFSIKLYKRRKAKRNTK